MPGFLVLDGWRIGLFQHLTLHFHIDFEIDVRGVDVRVAEPITYHVDIISRAQQVHGGRVPDRVRGDGLGLDGRTLLLRNGRVFADDMTDSEARDGSAVGVEKQMLGYRLLPGALLQVVLENGSRFRPQRAVAVFLALAEKMDLSGPGQTQIGELERDDFTDSSPGVVEQQKQDPVTDTCPGSDIHGIEDGLHFFLFQVVNRFMPRAFQRDCTNPLALRQQDGFFSGDKGE